MTPMGRCSAAEQFCHFDRVGGHTGHSDTGKQYRFRLGESGENILGTKRNEDIYTLLSVRLQLPQAVAEDALVSKYDI